MVLLKSGQRTFTNSGDTEVQEFDREVKRIACVEHCYLREAGSDVTAALRVESFEIDKGLVIVWIFTRNISNTNF